MPERAPFLASVVLMLGVAAAIALRWPAVHAGYQDDDYIQAAMLEGAFWIERGPLDLFWFSGRDAAEQRAMMDHGYLPWWTHPEHRVAMMRPFASGLLALEHALGLTPVAQHLVALGLFALCILAAYRLLRALVPLWVAVLGTVFYALDEAHSAPTAWLANRSTLISTLLAFLALDSYVRARSSPAGQLAPLARAFVLLALALVSGEYGYFALGYIAAFELLGPVKASWRALLGVLSTAAAVAGLAALLGYGVVSSGFYISPFRDAARFADAAFVRLPVLAFDLLLGIPSRWMHTGWPLRDIVLERGWLDARGWFELPSYGVVAGVTVWPALAALYFTVRALSRDRALMPLCYLVLGACLALIPAAGALPSPRLTGGSALGFAALFAALLVHAAGYAHRALLDRATGTSISRGLVATILVAAIAFTHGLLPAERALADARGSAHRAHSARKWALEADVPAQLSPATQVWLTSASDFTTAAHVPWARWRAGLPRIERLHLLSGAARAHDLFRIDDRTLEVQVLSSDAGGAFAGSLYRAQTAPLHDGDVIRLPGVTVRVVSTEAGDPLRIRFTADRSLDDPTIVLLCPEPSGIHRCAMPGLGEVLRLPRAPVPWGDPNLRYAKTLRPF